MKAVIALRGIPGPGRHSYAKRLKLKAEKQGKSVKVVSADQFFYNLGGGKQYAFDQLKLPEAHNFCYKEFIKAVQDQIDLIIVDNSNIESWEIAPYRMYALVNNYKFKIVEVHTDTDVAARIQKRKAPPNEVKPIKAMHDLMEESKIPDWWERHVTKLQPWESELSVDKQVDKALEDLKASTKTISALIKLANKIQQKYE